MREGVISLSDCVVFAAELAYSMSNNGTKGKPPSFIYEVVEKKLSKWVEDKE